MADNDDVPGSPDRDVEPAENTAPAAPEEPTVAQPVIPAEPAAAPILKTRWRDRAWTFQALLAVALAALLIGGIAGGVIVAAAGDDRDDHGRVFMGPGGPGNGMPPGWKHHRFNDGGPQWRWDDGPEAPDLTPYGQPTPPTPTPSQ
jgi:hypothetical protein